MLAERDSASCAQSGLNGPPWSAAGKTRLTRSMSRWLPWNWYSLDGTGWCYDAAWDDIRHCTDILGRADWNGVVHYESFEYRLGLPVGCVLALTLLAYLLAARLAFLEWLSGEEQKARDKEQPDDSTYAAVSPTPVSTQLALLIRWLDDGKASPRQWSDAAQRSLLYSLLTLLLVFIAVHPRLELLDSAEADAPPL